MNTLYWHDYETSGTDPRFDRPIQFAGLRTDEQLNIIGDPLMIYCQPAADVLPHPQASLITGITPQTIQQQGLIEAEFIGRIHAELSQPGTCGVGYNSLRFDDEFTRFTLFRNFYDAYAREWQNGNSRWDIIDMVRLTRALRPEGIEWPDRDDGLPSFRLEALTAANNIEHAGAHDALVDVRATIALAKLVKDRQPKLYDYLYQLRRKQQVAPLLNLHQATPVLHTSRMYPAAYCHTALVIPLLKDPNNNNGVIVYDLRHDPSILLEQDAETLREWLFTSAKDLPEGISRPALKTVHINKCPVVVPASTLDDAAAERLQIDRELSHQHLQQLREAGDSLQQKLQTIFSQQTFTDIDDVDASLYGGGFFDDNDKNNMTLVREADAEQLQTLSIPFNDPRLPEMLFRYRARNWPDSLNAAETEQWQQFCRHKLTASTSGGLTFDAFYAQLAECRQQQLTTLQQKTLTDLQHYAEQQKMALGIA